MSPLNKYIIRSRIVLSEYCSTGNRVCYNIKALVDGYLKTICSRTERGENDRRGRLYRPNFPRLTGGKYCDYRYPLVIAIYHVHYKYNVIHCKTY